MLKKNAVSYETNSFGCLSFNFYQKVHDKWQNRASIFRSSSYVNLLNKRYVLDK